MHSVITVTLEAIVFFLLGSGAAYFWLMARGALVLRRLAREAPREDNATLLKSRLTPAISVIVALRDSSGTSRALVRRLVGLHYAEHEVLAVLDSPGAGDLTAWSEEFHLSPSSRRIEGPLPMGTVRGIFESRDPIRLMVVALDPGSQALALNTAVNAAQSRVIGLFGAGCEFEPETLMRLIRPMLEEPDSTLAVCSVTPSQPEEGLIAQFASLSFLRGWLSRQAALSAWNLLTPTPGSAMLFLREPVLQAGGFRYGALDLILRIHKVGRSSKQKYRIAFVPAGGCRQRLPRSMPELHNELAREQKAAARAASSSALPLWLRAGLISHRFLWPLLETVAYVLTLVGLIAGWVTWQLAVLVLLSTIGLGLLLSMAAVSFRELADFQGSDPASLVRLLLAVIPENFGFRQMRNLWLLAPPGKRLDW